MSERKIIPIRAVAAGVETSSCEGGESFALMVMGDSMLPEFCEGEIIIIEPEGVARDGSFVLAFHEDEYIFRQLSLQAGRWYLKPLNDSYPTLEIPGMAAVKGVIIQKSKPGRRRANKHYI
jgi:SOS-response transcriptional repressor LexA